MNLAAPIGVGWNDLLGNFLQETFIMAVGYHRLNSSAARARIKAGRPQKDGQNEKHEMPEWMTKKALFRPGDVVVSNAFGEGVVQDFALTTVTPARVLFDCGEKLVVVSSITKK